MEMYIIRLSISSVRLAQPQSAHGSTDSGYPIQPGQVVDLIHRDRQPFTCLHSHLQPTENYQLTYLCAFTPFNVYCGPTV